MTYSEKLKSPKWQKKRLQILSRDGFTCRNCGNTENTLHVHHKFYRKGVEIWDYEDEVYETLCHECHSTITDLDKEINELLAHTVDDTLSKIFLKAILVHCDDVKSLIDALWGAIGRNHDATNALLSLYREPEAKALQII